MKNAVLFLTLLLVSCGYTIRPADPATISLGPEYVFDVKALPEILIEIEPEEWNRLLAFFAANPENEECVHADFTFIKNGQSETLTNVGFRIRGNVYSRMAPEDDIVHTADSTQWQQSHFRIIFDKYGKSQEFHTLEALNLKAFNGDPAMVREIYCFDLFQRFGVTIAPRSSYVLLSIHVIGDEYPAYFGVYRMNESIDGAMMKNRFPGDPAGQLWKCLWPADLVYSMMDDSIGMEKISPESQSMSEKFAYDLKTKKTDFAQAKSNLIQFAENLYKLEGKELKSWLDKNLDVHQFLKAYAVNVLVGMWDDYWNNKNNYYIYRHSSGMWYFIPYDYDNTLGTFTGGFDATVDVFSWGQWANDSQRPLISKVLSIPEYRQAYSNYLVTLIDPGKGLFDAWASMNRIKEWHAMIKPWVDNDTTGPKKIKDNPASWGEKPYYKLLSGDDDDYGSGVNYFKQRILYAQYQLNLIEE